jgi:branched-chain amino acid transport system ATP-binding protein
VARGETVALVGRNGAGKTTLLKTIMGIVRARRGQVRLDGADVTALPTYVIARRGITLVPEDRRIFPRLTVEENLRVALLARTARTDNGEPSPRDGGAAGLDEVFDYFPRLRERLGHAGQNLSGGEQQMLALARGFLTRPRIMLIDELSGGLMPLLVEQLMAILQRINAAGITILLIEQDLEVALAWPIGPTSSIRAPSSFRAAWTHCVRTPTSSSDISGLARRTSWTLSTGVASLSIGGWIGRRPGAGVRARRRTDQGRVLLPLSKALAVLGEDTFAGSPSD